MKVYRITLEKWSNTLQPSGYAARWNSNGVFVLYTSSSKPMACLENLVHRSGEGLNGNFKCMIIDVPDTIGINVINIEDLDADWFEYKNYSYCQDLGDKWVQKGDSAVLKVPSAIMKDECNYLFNPKHRAFEKIKISTIEDFVFDPRLKR